MSRKAENKVRGKIKKWDLAYNRHAHPREKSLKKGGESQAALYSNEGGKGGRRKTVTAWKPEKMAFKESKTNTSVFY